MSAKSENSGRGTILRSMQVAVLLVLLASFGSVLAREEKTAVPSSVMDNDRFVYEPWFYEEQIQKVLLVHGSPLADYQVHADGQVVPSARMILWTCLGEFRRLNPKIILTILEMRGHLLTDPQSSIGDDPLGIDLPQGLTEQVQWTGETLWAGYASFAVGNRQIAFRNGTQLIVPVEMNAASFAIGNLLAQMVETGQWAAEMDRFVTTYQQLFGEDPREPVPQLPSIAPFLTVKPAGPGSSFLKINSFFDHRYPMYTYDCNACGSNCCVCPADPDYATTRVDGQAKGGTCSSCILGYSCYDSHNGLDYSVASAPIYAAAAGTVVDVGSDHVDVDHGSGYLTTYWHLNNIRVSKWQQVNAGDWLANSDSHLHFGVVKAGKDIDPFGWWGDYPDPWASHGQGASSEWLWAGDGIADDSEAACQLFYRDAWYADNGHDGGSWWTYTTSDPNNSTNWGIWGTYISTAGQCEVFAYWKRTTSNTTSAKYQVFHAGGKSSVTMNQRDQGDTWVSLGSYSFSTGPATVILADLTDDNAAHIYFDAIKWECGGDTLPPDSQYVYTCNQGENDWCIAPVPVTLTASDVGGSGVRLIEYKIDNGDWQTHYGDTVSFVVSADGYHTIYYHAQDNAGNWENPPHEFSFQIDTSAPSNPTSVDAGCSAATDTWQNTCNDANFTWSGAADSTSGVAGYEVCWGTDPSCMSGSWTPSAGYDPGAVAEGTHYLSCRTKDTAGNWSDWTTLFILRYDTTAPSGSFFLNYGAAVTYATLVRTDSSVADNLSGVNQMRLRDAGESWGSWQPLRLTLKWLLPPITDHIHTVEVQFRDRAGNESLICAQSIYLELHPERSTSLSYGLARSTVGMTGAAHRCTANYCLGSTGGQSSGVGEMVSGNYRAALGYWQMGGLVGGRWVVYLTTVNKP